MYKYIRVYVPTLATDGVDAALLLFLFISSFSSSVNAHLHFHSNCYFQHFFFTESLNPPFSVCLSKEIIKDSDHGTDLGLSRLNIKGTSICLSP